MPRHPEPIKDKEPCPCDSCPLYHNCQDEELNPNLGDNCAEFLLYYYAAGEDGDDDWKFELKNRVARG